MPPRYEVRIQTIKRAQYLSKFGYNVTIVGGSYLHNTETNLIDTRDSFIKADYDGLKFIHIKTSAYKGNGLKRIISSIGFSLRFLFIARKLDKPDVVAQIATVPFGNILYFIAKKYNAKYIVDVVDLWPESMVSLGLISKYNPLTMLSYIAEKWLYNKADHIVFSMKGGRDYIIEKGWNVEAGGPINLKKVSYINNGVDLLEFEKNKALFKLDDEDLDDKDTFKVIYIGSIRLANDVKLLIDAAKKLKDHDQLKFLIYGDGSDRQYLEKYCEDNNITNVIFKQKWVEIKYVPYILSKSSLNLLNYKSSPILRFGGSQSKLFQYMASGKPICANIEMAYCPIKKYDIGLAKKFIDSTDYANAILSFFQMDDVRYSDICQNSLMAAENYDYEKLTRKFEKLLLI